MFMCTELLHIIMKRFYWLNNYARIPTRFTKKKF